MYISQAGMLINIFSIYVKWQIYKWVFHLKIHNFTNFKFLMKSWNHNTWIVKQEDPICHYPDYFSLGIPGGPSKPLSQSLSSWLIPGATSRGIGKMMLLYTSDRDQHIDYIWTVMVAKTIAGKYSTQKIDHHK